jgi:hypothetical protein
MNKQKLIDIFEKHSPNTQMSEDETILMFNLLMSEDPNFSCNIEEIDKNSEIYKHFKPLIESFQARVFLSRLKHMTSLKISLGALVILMHHMESAGKAVMLVFYLYYKLPVGKLITVETITELFPWGFFSNEQLNEIWDAQKVGTDDREGFTCIGAPNNTIDYLETWKELKANE